MKKIICSFLATFLFVTHSFALSSEDIATGAQSAVAMEMSTGRILYAKNAEKKMYIASTTKIMTAIIAIESAGMDEQVVVSNKAAWVGGSRMDLKKGETLSMEALLFGLMLKSGNDSAVAIAEHISGSVAEFANKMNDKAASIGLTDTKFQTPHGLDVEGHYSTAFDLARLTKYALQNPKFSEIVSTKNIHLGNRQLNNTNELLMNYPGADGVKTGYTGLAGRCLVASAKRNGMKVISVVLNCRDKKTRAMTSRKILDYCFDTYTMVNVISKNDFVDLIKVQKGKNESCQGWAQKDVSMPLTKQEDAALHFKVDLPTYLEAPVLKNVELGRLTAFIGSDILSHTPVVTLDEVERKTTLDFCKNFWKCWLVGEKFP